ncbi:MAG: hypothetical protein ACFE95_18825 [Candidatus Hodarchaeota archaeon]
MVAQHNASFLNSTLFAVPEALIFSILALAIAQAATIKITDNTDNPLIFLILVEIIGLITTFLLIGIYFLLEPISILILGSNWFSYLTSSYRFTIIIVSGIATVIFVPALAYSKRF